MTKEQEPPRLAGIHINLSEQVVTLEGEDGQTAQYSFAPAGVLFAAKQEAQQLPAERAEPAALPAAESENATRQEKEAKTTLIGRLNGRPQEGRVDRSGKPTAWVRLAAHPVGEEDWGLYLATFHRHTARIALGLASGTPLTVEGYLHPRSSPTRMDSISVVNILDYEGKPPKQ